MENQSDGAGMWKGHKMRLTVAFVLIGALYPAALVAAPYHGTVLDAETGQPLKGAVVVVQWSKRPIIQFGGGESFHSVREALTDASGQFAVSDFAGIDWNPCTTVKAPSVVIYKPGYEPLAPGLFALRRGFHSREELRRELKHGVSIRLPRLTPEQDRLGSSQRGLVLDLGSLGFAVPLPPERVPALVHLINSERRRFGLEPIRETAVGAHS